jgi:hypothetical protein
MGGSRKGREKIFSMRRGPEIREFEVRVELSTMNCPSATVVSLKFGSDLSFPA